jgi:hypothetical protein
VPPKRERPSCGRPHHTINTGPYKYAALLVGYGGSPFTDLLACLTVCFYHSPASAELIAIKVVFKKHMIDNPLLAVVRMPVHGNRVTDFDWAVLFAALFFCQFVGFLGRPQ